MKIERFEDIKAWQKAREIAEAVYKIQCKTSYGVDAGFKDQIQRAAVSVMNNIAEGFEYRNDKQFARYLAIARGSIGEVRSLLYVGLDLGYVEQGNWNTLVEKSVEIGKMITGLIKSLGD